MNLIVAALIAVAGAVAIGLIVAEVRAWLVRGSKGIVRLAARLLPEPYRSDYANGRIAKLIAIEDSPLSLVAVAIWTVVRAPLRAVRLRRPRSTPDEPGTDEEGQRAKRMPRRARTDSSHYRKLDRQSSIPLYHQLADALKDAIEASSLPPGSRFLTEREISERFEVSRPVIRSALDLLVGEGSIVRVRGSGSFIAPPKREVSVRGLVSSLLASDSDGLDLHILTARQESPDSTVAETLDIRHQHDPVAHVTAVMHRDDRPVYLIDSYVAATRLPWLPAAAQALQAGAKKMPDSSSRPELTRTEVSLKGGFFGHWGASRLGLSVGDPALIASFVQFGKTRRNRPERPLEFARIFYRTDDTEVSI